MTPGLKASTPLIYPHLRQFICELMLLFSFYSDGTLNPNGVRFGSAEIYNIGKKSHTQIFWQFMWHIPWSALILF